MAFVVKLLLTVEVLAVEVSFVLNVDVLVTELEGAEVEDVCVVAKLVSVLD